MIFSNQAGPSQEKAIFKTVGNFLAFLLALDPLPAHGGVVKLGGSNPNSWFPPSERKEQGRTCVKHPDLSVDYPRDCFLSHLTWSSELGMVA